MISAFHKKEGNIEQRIRCLFLCFFFFSLGEILPVARFTFKTKAGDKSRLRVADDFQRARQFSLAPQLPVAQRGVIGVTGLGELQRLCACALNLTPLNHVSLRLLFYL